MTKVELEEWFKVDFWPIYLNLMKVPKPSKWKAGDRGEALKKMLTLNPSADLRKRMINSLVAQMAHRRTLFDKCKSMQAYLKKVEYNQFYCNRQGKTWIQNMGWEAEIPSISQDYREPENTNGLCCKALNCKNPALGEKVPFCATCEHKNHGVYLPLMRDYMKKNKLTKNQDESIHDYAERCKKFYKQVIKPRMRDNFYESIEKEKVKEITKSS